MGNRGGACVTLQLALLPSILVQCPLGSRVVYNGLVLATCAARSDTVASLVRDSGLIASRVVARAHPPAHNLRPGHEPQ